jgi:glycerol-3-phosphate dehydrogenase
VIRHVPSDIESRTFDLLVIGAGINGVAIARDAAMRGLRVVVVDKGDIASGTTSWSTRLIHGGLRYLEHGEIGLVRESLRERERLLHNAPHLVRPLGLMLPIYEGAKRGPLLIRAGMLTYDLLSYDKTIDHHHMLSRDETIRRAPSINTAGLRSAALYYDAQATFPERLAVENALSASDHGALILTYTQVERFITEGAVLRGVEVTDLVSGSRFEICATWVVNVAGPWVDAVLAAGRNGSAERRFIGGTKGSHLVVAPFPGAPQEALYYEAKSDGRAVFVVPWNDLYLIGSTDIRYEGDLDDVRADDGEINYLLSETNALLPGAGLTRDDVLYTYCGVRPLPYQPAGREGAITRKHIIHNHAPSVHGLLSIIGGKLTTHRSLAEEVVDEIVKQLGRDADCQTRTVPLPGSPALGLGALEHRLTTVSGLQTGAASRLARTYGARAEAVLALARVHPELAQPVDEDSGAIAAEIVFAAREEMAESLADILLRRTMIGLGPSAGVGADERAARVGVAHLGWSEERAAREVASYRSHIERFRPKSLASISANAAT